MTKFALALNNNETGKTIDRVLPSYYNPQQQCHLLIVDLHRLAAALFLQLYYLKTDSFYDECLRRKYLLFFFKLIATKVQV